MPKFTFLKESQIWGDNALDVIKKYGTSAAATELTTIFGGDVDKYNRTSEDEPTCTYWSIDRDKQSYTVDMEELSERYFALTGCDDHLEDCCNDWRVRIVHLNGEMGLALTKNRTVSARPALNPTEASKIQYKNVKTGVNGVKICEYGEYPQTFVDKQTSSKLENLFKSKTLNATGKNYTFDSKAYPEYKLDGKQYIRVPVRGFLKTKPCWVQVQPIEWLMDESGWMVSKKCLFAGIQFDTKEEYDGNFSKTSIKHYLDTYFANEIEPAKQTNSLCENLTKRQQKAKDLIEIGKKYDHATRRAAAKAIKAKEGR